MLCEGKEMIRYRETLFICVQLFYNLPHALQYFFFLKTFVYGNRNSKKRKKIEIKRNLKKSNTKNA